MQPKAFTLTSNGGRLRALLSDLKVCEPSAITDGGNADSLPAYKGIWDTGATNSVITQKIVDELNLKPTGITKVNGVSGETTSPVYLVDFLLPLGLIIPGLRVTLGQLADGADALIGMDVITLGDLSVTNKLGRTKMTFRIPSMHEVDYVQEENERSLRNTIGNHGGQRNKAKRKTEKKNKKAGRKKR